MELEPPGTVHPAHDIAHQVLAVLVRAGCRPYLKGSGYKDLRNMDPEERAKSRPFVQLEFYAKTPLRVIRTVPSEAFGVEIRRWRGNKLVE